MHLIIYLTLSNSTSWSCSKLLWSNQALINHMINNELIRACRIDWNITGNYKGSIIYPHDFRRSESHHQKQRIHSNCDHSMEKQLHRDNSQTETYNTSLSSYSTNWTVHSFEIEKRIAGISINESEDCLWAWQPLETIGSVKANKR